jgi:S1-C subfamily serine protease
MRRLLTLSLIAAVAVPAIATAQERRPAPERDRAYTFRFGPDEEGFTIMRRGRLGVTVDMRPDAARDSIGALIAGVTPGGAAERAGVRAGDVATRFNGTRLAGPLAGSEDMDHQESHPAHRLIRFASRVDPGDTVRLEVRRDGRPQTFTFQAEEADVDMLVRRMAPLARQFMPALPDQIFGPGGRMMVTIGGGILNDLELVKVNPGLGEYFGTNEGLLVTNIGSDSALGLRSGDVILSIGGRRPTSASHAMRILSTYESGETVQFEVMRQRRRTTVNGRMPQSREGEWRIRRNSFELPIPDIHILPRDVHPRIEVNPRIEIEHPPIRQLTIIKT